MCAVVNDKICKSQQFSTKPPYTTNMALCGTKSCSPDQRPSPICECDYPYAGTMVFRERGFSNLSNTTRFRSLESALWTKLTLNPGSVTLQNLFFNTDNYQVQLELFPSHGQYFTRADIQRIRFGRSNQTYKPPHEFGPYYFIASPYPFADGSGGAGLSTTGYWNSSWLCCSDYRARRGRNICLPTKETCRESY